MDLCYVSGRTCFSKCEKVPDLDHSPRPPSHGHYKKHFSKFIRLVTPPLREPAADFIFHFTLKKWYVTDPCRSPLPYGRAVTGYSSKEIYRWLFTPVNVSCHSSWDYYSQCHWPRCVRRWAGNHSASDVNVSGGQSTHLGHGETLAFWILFLNPSSSFFV